MSKDEQAVDLQRFIDSFRRLLQGWENAQRDELAQAIEDYARQCDKANQRLRECYALIQRGQYSNAVALAEQGSNLLDQCGMLEIPERDMVGSAAQYVEIKPPTLLNLELIEALQEACQKYNSASGNLRLLHQLTLARAPLPTRLAVMRRLLVQNPNHPFMDADIRAFELAWFTQAFEFAQRNSDENPGLVEEILQDFETSGYLETPPPALLTSLQGLLTRKQAAELPGLAQKIREAFAQQSIDALQPLIRRWYELVELVGDPDATERLGVAEAADCLNHVLEEQARANQGLEARDRLCGLLHERKLRREALEAAFQTAQMFNQVDSSLEWQYQERLRRERQRQIRSRFLTAGAAAALIGGAIVATFLTSRAATTRRIDGLIAEIDERMKAEDFESVAAAAEGKPAIVLAHPAIAERINTAAEKAKKQRTWNQAVGKIQDCPGDQDVAPLVASARELADSDPAKKQIDELEEGWRQRRLAWQQGEKSKFEAQVAALVEDAKHLQKVAEIGQATAGQQTEIDEFHRRVAALRERGQALGQNAPALDDIDKSLQQVASWTRMAPKLEKLERNLKKVGPGDDALGYIAEFLTENQSPPAEKESPDRVKEVERSLSTWKDALHLGLSLQAGKSVPAAGDHWKGQPPAMIIAKASRLTDMMRQRNASVASSAAAELKAYCGRPEISETWRIVIPDRENLRPYYALAKPVLAEGGLTADVLRGFDGSTTSLSLPEKSVVSRAPHAVFAESAAPLWGPSDANKWHKQLADQYRKLAEDNKMEVLVKLILIRKLLTLAAKGSDGYSEQLQKLREYREIIAAGDNDENWLDPSNDFKQPRRAARELIAAAPSLNPAVALQHDTELESGIKNSLLLTGWVSRNPQGELVVARFAGVSPGAHSRLYTVAAQKWIELGIVNEDSERLNDRASDYVGWPVFSLISFAN